MISLYTSGTPNGQKASITLEELGLKYETTHIDLGNNKQKEDWFLNINRKFTISSGFLDISSDFLFPISPDLSQSLVERLSGICLLTCIANGRIPAIVDRTGGKEKRVFESGALMLYLCSKYDKEYKISFPYDSDQ